MSADALPTLPSNRVAVVLMIDGLRADMLGPYGNTWLDTPRFNRLASEAAMFEHVWSDSPHLSAAIASVLSGMPARPSSPETSGDSQSVTEALPSLLRRAGVACRLLTDSAEVAQSKVAAKFDTCVLVPDEPVLDAAMSLEQTAMARLASTAAEMIEQLDASAATLLWIHARGMFGPWDAPTDLRHQFADDDDPLPDDFVEPPEQHLTAPADPDELLKLTHAYAGQVTVIDECLAVIMAAIDSRASDTPPLVIVTSPRGYPLGEHGRIGLCDAALYGELLQLPLFIRDADTAHVMSRSQSLVQTRDLFTTLRTWFMESTTNEAIGWSRDLLPLLEQEEAPDQQRLAVFTDTESAVRTPSWFLRHDGSRDELFVKPDDRWEVNEIADRCATQLEQIKAVETQLRDAIGHPQPPALPPLPEELYLPPN